MTLFDGTDGKRLAEERTKKIKAKVLKGISDLKALVEAKGTLKWFGVREAWTNNGKDADDAILIGTDEYRTRVGVEFRTVYFSYSNPARATGEIEVLIRWNHWLGNLRRVTRKLSVRENDELDIQKYYEQAVKWVNRAIPAAQSSDEAEKKREEKRDAEKKCRARDFPEGTEGMDLYFCEERGGQAIWTVDVDKFYGLTTEQVRKLEKVIAEFHK